MDSEAWELFAWMRQQDDGSHPKSLCDVFLYSAMISLISGQRDLSQAFDLSREMMERGVERNVHTFSALMNCCIKAGDFAAALEVFSDMQATGCQPNVVTYNTLIDLYGKTGQWGDAIRVLDKMRAEVSHLWWGLYTPHSKRPFMDWASLRGQLHVDIGELI